MNKYLGWIKKTRTSLLNMTSDLSLEQINKVPEGFNNNIIWNLGHLVAAQQGICYVRSGLSPVVEDQFISPYKKGTKPERFVSDKEVEAVKSLLSSSLDQLEVDYEMGKFNNYNAWTTPYGVELVSIDDAILFLQFHEGLHFGYVMAQRRLVNN
jgi:hypothetical protein